MSEAGVIPVLDLSHIGIVRSATAFRGHPIDVLGGILDVAGFTVDAVLGIDLQPWRVLAIPHDLIHARRAIALLGRIVQRQINPDRHGRIFQSQVAGLNLLVIGVGDEHR